MSELDINALIEKAVASALAKITPQQAQLSQQAQPPDPATAAREICFQKWLEVQNATHHCASIGGKARADALKAWHKLMIEFGELHMKMEQFPIESPQQPIETKSA